MDEMETTSEAAAEALAGTESQLAAELAASREVERMAVERLRQALLATEPSIEPSMVIGATVEEVEGSFAAAKAVLTRLREAVAKETAGRIPPGAPGRARSSARTPFEKIRDGLADRQ